MPGLIACPPGQPTGGAQTVAATGFRRLTLLARLGSKVEGAAVLEPQVCLRFSSKGCFSFMETLAQVPEAIWVLKNKRRVVEMHREYGAPRWDIWEWWCWTDSKVKKNEKKEAEKVRNSSSKIKRLDNQSDGVGVVARSIRQVRGMLLSPAKHDSARLAFCICHCLIVHRRKTSTFSSSCISTASHTLVTTGISSFQPAQATAAFSAFSVLQNPTSGG